MERLQIYGKFLVHQLNNSVLPYCILYTQYFQFKKNDKKLYIFFMEMYKSVYSMSLVSPKILEFL